MTQAPIKLSHRCILRLSGPDTLTLLERLVTSTTSDWAAGEARYGALLTPQGKVISDFLALRTPDGVWLDTDRCEAPNLAKRLQMFRLRSQVDINLDPKLDVWAMPAHLYESLPDRVHHFTDPRHMDCPKRIICRARDTVASPEGLATYHAERIRLGLPEQGIDFGSSEVFPADINMDRLNGVDLKKGCFVGQEVVSRMHRRGTIRKRTLILAAEGVAAGEEIICRGRPAGRVTSTSGGLALARLRLDRIEAGSARLLAGDVPVSLIGPDWVSDERTALNAVE